jgi:hypothetical protein
MRCPNTEEIVLLVVDPHLGIGGDASCTGEALTKSTAKGFADSRELAAAMGADEGEASKETLGGSRLRPQPLLPPLLGRFALALRSILPTW